MEPAKKYFQEHQQELLDEYNNILFQEQWDRYASGTYSTWEMASLGYYYHEHELANINYDMYGIRAYQDLPTEPPIEYNISRNGRTYPIFQTCRIIGTVIGKNNTKATIDVLTRESGVVTIKFNLDFFALYNRRISEIVNGETKVVEQGWFQRGTLIMVNGYRNHDVFRAKTYKRTPSSQLYKITNIEGQAIKFTDKRYGEEEL